MYISTVSVSVECTAEVWSPFMQRCTWYNIMWSSLSCRDVLNTTLCDKVCHTEMYLIQHYVIKFVMWGVLDTTLCDKVCHTEMYLIQNYVIKFVMQRFTWYNIMWLSLSCRDLLDTTLCDKVCHTEMYLKQHDVIKFVLQRFTWYNIMW
jgi:hypothetical protein